MIRILVVDDSRTAREALRQAIESDGDMVVVGEAETGEQALSAVRRVQPDLVTMDVYLRRENGLDVAATLMGEAPCPILVVTGVNASDPALVYRAMAAGALEVTSKPPGPLSSDYLPARKRLLRLIRALSKVPVVHHFSHRRGGPTKPSASTAASPPAAGKPRSASPPSPSAPRRGPGRDLTARSTKPLQSVLIGASTGGPALLSDLLRRLPAPYALPLVVIQHISEGFGMGFSRWLADVTRHDIVVVKEPTMLRPGAIYLAADGQHLRFLSQNQLGPQTAQGKPGFAPSYDVLLESAARFGGPGLACVLTGMGRDGTAGFEALQSARAQWQTIAQEPESCVVGSMPSSVIRAGLAHEVQDPDQILSTLISLTDPSEQGRAS